MNNLPLRVLRTVVTHYPAVIPYLKGRARWVAFVYEAHDYKFWWSTDANIQIQLAYKTYDYFLSNLERLIASVYNNDLGGEFIDIMANLISGQLTQAYEQAWADEEGEGDLPDYLTGPLEEMILGQYDFVDGFYREIVDARVDEEPIDALLARAALWANQWTSAYNEAVRLITLENGGNMVWQFGDTEHCETCRQLDGIIAPASVWDELGVHPQQPENDLLDCGGWRCGCSLTPTDQRKSPKAYDLILNAVSK